VPVPVPVPCLVSLELLLLDECGILELVLSLRALLCKTLTSGGPPTGRVAQRNLS
jgi:hypothetical protein